jgi:hypothetical protein
MATPSRYHCSVVGQALETTPQKMAGSPGHTVMLVGPTSVGGVGDTVII